jgi:hypothetical protein
MLLAGHMNVRGLENENSGGMRSDGAKKKDKRCVLSEPSPGFYSRVAPCAQRLPIGEETFSLALHLLSLILRLCAHKFSITLPVSGHDAHQP